MTKSTAFKVTMEPLERLHRYANNPRRNASAVSKVAASIEAFGFRQPIVVDDDWEILVGDTRYLAAQQLGLTKVPVHQAIGLSVEQKKAFRIADNRTGEIALWDDERLIVEFKDLADKRELELTGFNEARIKSLLERGEQGSGRSQRIEPEEHLVIIECEDESEQQRIYQEMTERGLACRLMS